MRQNKKIKYILVMAVELRNIFFIFLERHHGSPQIHY